MTRKKSAFALILVLMVALLGCSEPEKVEPKSEKLTKELVEKRIAGFLESHKPDLKTEFSIGSATEFYDFKDFIEVYKEKRLAFMLELKSALHAPSELEEMLNAATRAIFRKYGNRHYAVVELSDYHEYDKRAREFRVYKQYFFAAYENDEGKWVVFELEPLFIEPGARLEFREYKPE